jgi:8-oxo-dGTP diphosphatase
MLVTGYSGIAGASGVYLLICLLYHFSYRIETVVAYAREMEVLLTLHQQDVEPDAPTRDTNGYELREAARAVLLDDVGHVYLMHVSRRGFHKLPGGGVDPGETVQEALHRELLEEMGYRAEVLVEVGQTEEFRDASRLHQKSYCFLARRTGEQQAPALEPGEIADGMVELRAANIDEAIDRLRHDTPSDTGGEFIRRRDLTLLEAAKPLIMQLIGPFQGELSHKPTA